MDKMDRLHRSVEDELKPSEVLKRLHELGLLDDDEVKEFKAMSLRERGAVMVEASDSANVVSDGADSRHDPWWFGDDGAVTHGEPEDVTVPTVFHGTLSSATHHPGYIDNNSVWNFTDDSGIHGRFWQKVIGRMLQSHDVTLTDVGQLSSMLIPEKKGDERCPIGSVVDEVQAEHCFDDGWELNDSVGSLRDATPESAVWTSNASAESLSTRCWSSHIEDASCVVL